MSWVFGFIGQNLNSDRIKKFATIHHQPIHRIETNNIYIAAGGIKQTCQLGVFSESSGWLVVGSGIKKEAGQFRILSSVDWQSILTSDEVRLHELDGHFVVIKWQANQIKFFTDQLGLRTIYLAKTDNGIVFSTRVDWLARLLNNSQIDFEAFGAHWLTFNQISYDSMIKGIKRLGPNGFAVCNPTSLQVESKPWKPIAVSSDKSPEELEQYLMAFIQPKIEENYTRSLALSGGLDSRVILALLMSESKKSFSLHTFSHRSDPDVIIAQRIAQENDLQSFYFDAPLPKPDDCLVILKEYIGQTCANEPASTFLKLRYYPIIHSQNKFIIDGGFGEIWRRQYLNRLLKRGKKALLSGNPCLIYHYLLRQRASIFNEDVVRTMHKGIEKQIESLWQTMPKIEEIGEENFLDLMAIRTRFPNSGCYEQARMDCEVLNYMPFAQPSFLQMLFKTPLQLRRNGNLLRQIIHKHYPGLARYPLVKNNTTYPFYFPPIPAWVWTKFKAKLGLSFSDPTVIEFLSVMKDFILDIVHSNEVKNYSAYDYPAILCLIEQFYAGRKELANELDWWLSFELFRRIINAH
ncbi:MAG: hypothetical protein ACETVX_05330 [bacterium]